MADQHSYLPITHKYCLPCHANLIFSHYTILFLSSCNTQLPDSMDWTVFSFTYFMHPCSYCDILASSIYIYAQLSKFKLPLGLQEAAVGRKGGRNNFIVQVSIILRILLRLHCNVKKTYLIQTLFPSRYNSTAKEPHTTNWPPSAHNYIFNSLMAHGGGLFLCLDVFVL